MLRAVAFLLATLVALPTHGTAAGDCTGTLTAARYDGPTTRYPHGVLGDTVEWTELHVRIAGCKGLTATLPDALVFEDTAPRLVDVTGDGAPEVIVVESHQTKGARLAIWGMGEGGFGRIAATPHIGQRFRWLAPAGAADLDGDGRIEIAYVDRPHLARILRIWRLDGGRLVEVASAEGHTNHRIGETDIAGGIRNCGPGPEVVTADADWTQVLVTRVEAGKAATRNIGPHKGRSSFARALRCDPVE